MPRVPEIVEHAVAKLMTKKGYSRKKAYKIIVGRFQDLGILKKNSLTLTEKGRKVSQKHYKEPKRVRLRKINIARKRKKRRL